MQLRDATYAGISFFLIAGTLWLVALRSPESKPAPGDDIKTIDLTADTDTSIKPTVLLTSIADLNSDLRPVTNSIEDRSDEAKLFASEPTAPHKMNPKQVAADNVQQDQSQIKPSNTAVKGEASYQDVLTTTKPTANIPGLSTTANIERHVQAFEGIVNKYYNPTNAKAMPQSPTDQQLAVKTATKSAAKKQLAEKQVEEKQTVVKQLVDTSPIFKQPANKQPAATETEDPSVRGGGKLSAPKTTNPDAPVDTVAKLDAKIADSEADETTESRKADRAETAEKNPKNNKSEHPVKPAEAKPETKTGDQGESTDVNENTLVANDQSDADASESQSLALSPELVWWKKAVKESIVKSETTDQVDLDSMLMNAMVNSPTIIAISQEPLIEQQEVIRAESQFDPEAFMRTQFDSRNDPVGNTLTVAPGVEFLKDNIWSGNAGFRKKLRTGASIDTKQELGFKNSNSTFFEPKDQGTATWSLNFSQPLLRGGGRLYNESRTYLAQSIANTSVQRYQTELQDELLKVAEAYWKLYYFRCRLVQIRNNIDRGEKVLKRLEDRARLDSIPSQIARARAAVQSRRSQVANAERDVRNAETTIRKLLATPNWASQYDVEMLPIDHPSYDHIDLPVESVVETALDQRPEVKQALQRARSAAIQLDISRNELLPELNLLLGGYVSALNGDSGVLTSYGDQFGNRPGYYIGVEFRMPYRNREANSVYRQRVFNMKKITAEVDVAIQSVIADSQVSLRQVNSAYETLGSTISAIQAARADLDYQQRRWESFAIIEGDFAEGQNPATLLDQLLESQQRLTNEELNFSRAEFDFKVAQYYLKKSMGTLLQVTELPPLELQPTGSNQSPEPVNEQPVSEQPDTEQPASDSAE